MSTPDGQTDQTLRPPTGSKLKALLCRLRMWVLLTFRYRLVSVRRGLTPAAHAQRALAILRDAAGASDASAERT